MQSLTSWLMKYRFPILCLAVFGVMCLQTRSGQWTEDFWEHSAVVRELATHTLHPKHPQLLLDAPHAFYSPYAVTVALLARMLHLDAVTALSVMGLVNLCLLFLGLRFFVFSVVPRYRSATAFYTLLLTLFCWGSAPWVWSGFFHIRALRYVLPYPSTFAAACTLIALGVNQLRIASKRQIWLVPIFLIAVTVLISHPITFLILSVGLVMQSCAEKGSAPSQFVLVGGVLILAFFASLFWPYFPMMNLFVGKLGVFNASNKIVYQQVLSRIWPSLIAVPLLVADARSNWRRPLVLMLMALLGIYVFGAISGEYSCGRVISYIVLLFHITMAEHLAALESRVQEARVSSWLQRLIVPASVTVLVLLLSMNPLKGAVVHALFAQPPPYTSYRFLSQFTRQDDVVLADLENSWIVPTFGGKVVASLHPLAFVPDQHVRKSDLEHFFHGEAMLRERQQIIKKYKANYLLLRKSNDKIWQDLQQSFLPQGEVVFESDCFVLISLKPKLGKDTINENSGPFVSGKTDPI